MISYLVVCTVSLLVSTLTLFSGFGLGTLLLPAFSFFFPIQVAIGATAIVHLANNVFKAFLVGRMADLKTTLKFALPAALAAALGAWLLAHLGDIPPITSYNLFEHRFQIEPIKMIIGLLIGVFSFLELLPWFQRVNLDPKYIPLGGLLSGFFGGLSGLQGALRSMFLIRVGLSKEQFVGTTVLSAIIVDVARIAVYGYAIFGQHMANLQAQGAFGPMIAGTIAALVGSIAGNQLLKKTTLGTVQKIVGILLLILALALITGLI